MAQVSSLAALVKVVSHDLIDSTIGIDPATMEFYNGNMKNSLCFRKTLQFHIHFLRMDEK